MIDARAHLHYSGRLPVVVYGTGSAVGDRGALPQAGNCPAHGDKSSTTGRKQ